MLTGLVVSLWTSHPALNLESRLMAPKVPEDQIQFLVMELRVNIRMRPAGTGRETSPVMQYLGLNPEFPLKDLMAPADPNHSHVRSPRNKMSRFGTGLAINPEVLYLAQDQLEGLTFPEVRTRFPEMGPQGTRMAQVLIGHVISRETLSRGSQWVPSMV